MKTSPHQHCPLAYTNVYRTHLAILVLFLLLNCLNSHGQQPELGTPPITNFAKSEFDAGTQNWCIAQDENGIVYFGNNKGLLQFNGKTWQTFPLPNFTIVRSVSIANPNKVFVGGQNEFGYFETAASGEREYYTLTTDVPELNINFEDVWQTFVIDNKYYFCSEKAIFKLENGECDAIVPDEGKFENFFFLNDKLFVQVREVGIYSVDGLALTLDLKASELPKDRIVSILNGRQNEKLFITFSNGILIWSDDGLSEWDCPASSFIKDQKAYCAIALEDGRYAIGTTQNGVIVINEDGDIESHINKEKGLQNNTILCIYEDLSKNLWLGLDNGIAYIEISSPFKFIGSVEGIEGTGYAAIAKNGVLMLATNQGLYTKPFPEDSGHIQPSKFTQVKESKGQVWGISELENELIINRHEQTLIYRDSALYPMSPVDGAWDFYPLKSQPNYALQGTYNGFYYYEKTNSDTSGAWVLKGKLKGFDESARIFQEDKSGNIWISHAYRGLYRLTFNSAPFELEEVKVFGYEQGLPNNLYINSSSIRGELIYTTPSGIYNYDIERDTFFVQQDLTQLLGSNRSVNRIIEDNLGNIWFSMEDQFGVIKIQEQGVFNDVEIYRFDELQDDLVDGFEQIYAFDTQNTFIAAENGFIHYDGTSNHNPNFLFDLEINRVTNVSNNDSTLFVSGFSDTFSEIILPSNINALSFLFNAPSYSQLNNIKYRYKLEGLDNEWSQWTERNDKDYTNLGNGTYSFLVEAKNSFGKISNQASFQFEILPPWYASTIARIIYVCLGFLGLFAIFRAISIREAKKTHAFKEEQTEKLERKEAEFKKEVSRNESELIKLRNEKLSLDIKHRNSELASTTMHLVQKSEILIKIKSDLNELGKEAPNELKQKVKQIERTIEADVRLDKNWERFETYFDQVHQNFFKQLRSAYPELTPKDQKLCAYLRMNLTTKEIAPLLNISVRGVEISRYRLRKKMGLDSNTNLVSYIMEI